MTNKRNKLIKELLHAAWVIAEGRVWWYGLGKWELTFLDSRAIKFTGPLWNAELLRDAAYELMEKEK
jgi:hypothetical protein